MHLTSAVCALAAVLALTASATPVGPTTYLIAQGSDKPLLDHPVLFSRGIGQVLVAGPRARQLEIRAAGESSFAGKPSLLSARSPGGSPSRDYYKDTEDNKFRMTTKTKTKTKMKHYSSGTTMGKTAETVRIGGAGMPTITAPRAPTKIRQTTHQTRTYEFGGQASTVTPPPPPPAHQTVVHVQQPGPAPSFNPAPAGKSKQTQADAPAGTSGGGHDKSEKKHHGIHLPHLGELLPEKLYASPLNYRI